MPNNGPPSWGGEGTPTKKPNVSLSSPLRFANTPRPTAQRMQHGTPSTAARFGFTDRGASSLVARVDTFTTLVKCIARVVEDCGGRLEEEKHLGAYVMDAVNAVTVCPL